MVEQPELSAADVEIVPFTRPRTELRNLFELAEDSAAAIDASIDAGLVLVAERNGTVVGHLQLTFFDDPLDAEIKNMAVVGSHQGRGIGRGLVAAGVVAARTAGATRLLVATATADVGNLRFYQRQGFRFLTVERDAFTAETGYPGPIVIDGIELQDRVWLDRRI